MRTSRRVDWNTAGANACVVWLWLLSDDAAVQKQSASFRIERLLIIDSHAGMWPCELWQIPRSFCSSRFVVVGVCTSPFLELCKLVVYSMIDCRYTQ